MRAWVRRQLRWRPRLRPQLEAPVVVDSEVGRRTWLSVSSGGHVLMMAHAPAPCDALPGWTPASRSWTSTSLSSSCPCRAASGRPGREGERLHRSILASRSCQRRLRAARQGRVHAGPHPPRATPSPLIRDTFASPSWKVGRCVAAPPRRKLFGSSSPSKILDLPYLRNLGNFCCRGLASREFGLFYRPTWAHVEATVQSRRGDNGERPLRAPRCLFLWAIFGTLSRQRPMSETCDGPADTRRHRVRAPATCQ